MLDNFKPEKMKEVAKNLKTQFQNIIIEVSGGITIDNLSDYFSPHVDIISMGSLTQGVPHIDFSLKIKLLFKKEKKEKEKGKRK